MIWCSSAVSRSLGFLAIARRIRSTAWDTLPRLCVRRVLWLTEFPLVPSLRSTGSAEGRPSLFARFIATMDESDCFVPSIMSFGLLLSHATPGRPPGVK